MFTLYSMFILDCNVLTTTAQSGQRAAFVQKLELFLCRLLSLYQCAYPIQTKIEYLEMRRKIKGIILYSIHEKLSDDVQLPSRIQDQQ